jgi:L-seryl-tRNA(Ser) seleniumtransferase
MSDMINDKQKKLRRLPGVDSFLMSTDLKVLIELYGRTLVIDGTRIVFESWRTKLSNSSTTAPDEDMLIAEVQSWLKDQLAPTLRPVINATGVIIHTNLGRAPLNLATMEYSSSVSTGYSSLEYEVEDGVRGSRSIHTEKSLVRLTGAEAALVVNNNAAAVLLMLTALCRDKEVIISRGQLIEIGGGFRIPDVLRQSGAALVEIGTTNKTHLSDYRSAINEKTGAILVAHQSNFKVVGFASEPNLNELSAISTEASVPLLYDQGSGVLRDLSPFGLEKEPTVQDALDDGADIVAFSGDKLLGGPQAGILCGRKSLLSDIKRHPLARAVRADKLCLSALSSTLESYLTGRELEEIPVWQMISRSLDSIDESAQEWTRFLGQNGVNAMVIDGNSTVGGGSVPGSMLPTKLVAVTSEEVDSLAEKLRVSRTPVIGRIANDQLLLDPRTVLPGQQDDLLEAVTSCAAN